ncbi:hypothetical protein HPB49_007671 [Dermacentor silvarum]|uniref:Uncharacterized protein n=1 Tax=Dermacentor silvarum TaxID=543639 RepID=A0ACB8CQE0_DERSI|nr:hypothetical protein HPB49_007671 [Dermacentor silvarum]
MAPSCTPAAAEAAALESAVKLVEGALQSDSAYPLLVDQFAAYGPLPSCSGLQDLDYPADPCCAAAPAPGASTLLRRVPLPAELVEQSNCSHSIEQRVVLCITCSVRCCTLDCGREPLAVLAVVSVRAAVYLEDAAFGNVLRQLRGDSIARQPCHVYGRQFVRASWKYWRSPSSKPSWGVCTQQCFVRGAIVLDVGEIHARQQPDYALKFSVFQLKWVDAAAQAHFFFVVQSLRPPKDGDRQHGGNRGRR